MKFNGCSRRVQLPVRFSTLDVNIQTRTELLLSLKTYKNWSGWRILQSQPLPSEGSRLLLTLHPEIRLPSTLLNSPIRKRNCKLKMYAMQIGKQS